MQIVTDSAADLSPKQISGLPIHFAPLRISLGGKPFTEDYETFYKKLGETDDYPTTSQASAGDFAKLYSTIAKKDPNILSIHISSGLSGTLNAARVGAAMAPEANVTFWDSMTLSAALGWQVQAAALALKKNWPLPKILERLNLIRSQVEGMFTMKEIRYLVHGGRISHLKGLLAQVLNIKPIINVSKETGMYGQAGQEVTFKRAIARMVQVDADLFKDSGKLRAQIVNGNCPEGISFLKAKAAEKLDCSFEDTIPVAPALGAHVGASLTGIIVGPMSLFTELF